MNNYILPEFDRSSDENIRIQAYKIKDLLTAIRKPMDEEEKVILARHRNELREFNEKWRSTKTKIDRLQQDLQDMCIHDFHNSRYCIICDIHISDGIIIKDA